MADVAWRCERPSDGDVKYAARRDHMEILEDRGYICELDPDPIYTTDLLFEPEE